MALSQAKCLSGTTLEGGGQLLRVATALSALTRRSIQIDNIRGNRSGGGGLKAQHLTAVRWLASASGAKTEGMSIKSKSLTFEPAARDATTSGTDGKADAARMETMIEIGSPGAVSLVFQAILPFVLFSSDQSEPVPVHITIRGGTNVSNSPSIDYLRLVLFPMLSRIGLGTVSVDIRSRGWSLGRSDIGTASFSITPIAKGEKLPAFQLKDRGDIVCIEAVVLAPKATEEVLVGELRRTVCKTLPELRDIPLEVRFEDSRHPKRVYLLLVATSKTGCKLGRDWLYGAEGDFKIRTKGKKRAESSAPTAVVAEQLVGRVLRDLGRELSHGGCVDEYMRDQLAVFQALADGRSVVDAGRTDDGDKVEPSLHAKTAHWVSEELIGVKFDGDGSCEGVGFVVGEDLIPQSRPEHDDVAEELVEQLDELHV